MRKATFNDKDLVVDILSQSFNENKSINFVVKQDKKRAQRVKTLMEYSFFTGMRSGAVYIDDTNLACAIFLHEKKTTLSSVLWDLKLVFKVIGIKNVFNVLKREQEIAKNQPKSDFKHLWYLGVFPKSQGKGIGSKFLTDLLDFYKNDLVYLETSTLRNLPLYKRHSFSIINEINLGYKLFILKK